MKKALLLGIATILFPAASHAQEPSFTPPLPKLVGPALPFAPPPGQIVFDEKLPTTPAGPYFNYVQPKSQPRFWANADVLFWWTKQAQITTPLVTRALDPNDPTSGILGSDTTSVVLGADSYNYNSRYGGRVTLGGWFDSGACRGFEGSYFYLAPRTVTRSVGTDGAPGDPDFALPFRDAVSGVETAVPFAGPTAFGGVPSTGTALVRLSNKFQGGDINFLARLGRNDQYNLVGMVGFRYLRLEEDLDFAAELQIPANGESYVWQDSFQAGNSFYGAQVGLRGECCFNRFSCTVTAKIAVGAMNQTMDISGVGNAVNFPTTFTTDTGGFYALASNIGSYNRNQFAVIPEVDLKVGYNLTRNLQAVAGYNFLYINNVTRPGTAIDHSLNPRSQSQAFGGSPANLTGPASPSYSFQRSDFWAQGATFGLQLRY